MTRIDDRTIGWGFVGAQVVLLGALILLPGRDDWPTPRWLHQVGTVVNIVGLGVIVVAALGLGSALTPTPLPKERGELSTNGLYRFVRHPIYSGVLLVVVALVVSSGSWLHAVVGVATVGFFTSKATWEEQRLSKRFPAYAAYARRTPRFVPNPLKRRR